MIAKGNLHGDGGTLIDYLLKGDRDARAEFASARGFEMFGDDLSDAARLMQRMADATTHAEKVWFHVQTRLPPGEQMSRAQWDQTFDREEQRLGFTGLPRVTSFHIDRVTGEVHGHAAWFRLDAATGEVRDPGLFKLRLMEVARGCERDFGLQEVSNTRQPDDRARAPERNEMEESRRLGTDVRTIRAAILDCLEHADSGKAFAAALDERGLMLANGDRRDCFVVIDEAGGHHALNKKLTGLTLNEMRERMADLDRSQLPGVEQAQEMQRDRAAERAMQAAHREAQSRTDDVRPEPRQDAAKETPVREPEPAAREMVMEPANDMQSAGSVIGGFLRGFERMAEKLFDYLSEFLAPAPPPSKDQAERMERAAEEQHQARADEDAQQEKASDLDRLIAEMQKQQQRDQDLYDRFPHLTRDADRDRDDDYDRGRERER